MHVLVALLTPDFHESKWTDQEVGFAIGKGVLVRGGKEIALLVFGTLLSVARGVALQLPDQAQGVVTYHPSYLLRVADAEAKAKAYALFVQDLRFAWGLAA